MKKTLIKLLSISCLAFGVSAIAAPVLQLRLPLNDASPGTNTPSDTSSGGINVAFGLFTNGTAFGDLHGAAGTGITALNANAMAIDMTATTVASQGATQPGNNSGVGPEIKLVGNATLGTGLGSSGVLTNFIITFWSKSVANPAGTLYPRMFELSPGNGNVDYNNAAAIGMQYNGTGQMFYAVAGTTLTGTIPGSIPVGQWTFWALAYDGANIYGYEGTDTTPVQQVGVLAAGGKTVTLGATGTLEIGNEQNKGYARPFNGYYSDFRVYNGTAGSAANNLAYLTYVQNQQLVAPTPLPTFIVPPTSQVLPVNSTLTFNCLVGNGTSYQWMAGAIGSGVYTNLVAGGQVITSTTNTTLVITNLLAGNNADYVLVASNSFGVVTSSPPATVTTYQLIGGTLTDLMTSNSITAGGFDIYQFDSPVVGAAVPALYGEDGLNYYTDNGSKNTTGYAGETFQTGTNSQGYNMTSLSILLAGTSNPTAITNTVTTGVNVLSNNYYLYIYSVANNQATVLYQITNGGLSFQYPDWLQWTFPTILLQSNATYAYGFGRGSNVASYAGLSIVTATNTGGNVNPYAGGQACTISGTGGAITYGGSGAFSGTFDIGLVPVGLSAPIPSVPVATPNPAYARSPVKLAATASGIVGSGFTYQWLTDDGTAASPPNYITLTGFSASNTNFTVVPKDIGNGNPYTTNYYVKVFNGSSSAISTVVTVTVNPATAPVLTPPAVTNLSRFAGSNAKAVLSFAESGTLPITNQWLFDNGTGGSVFSPLTGQANTTLTLTNLMPSASGNYMLIATNIVGSTNSIELNLSVLPVPVIVPSQNFAYKVLTNTPWAFWRLNETNDPTQPNAPIYQAYDYSGNGFNASYGVDVQVGQPGPQPPPYVGFETNNLAAATTSTGANGSGFLTAPDLHLPVTTNLTFMVWLNPNQTQNGSAGILFNRGGPDNAAGFCFANVSTDLGYTWNQNNATTYNWDSLLAPQVGSWNFVTYVLTPTNMTVYLGYVDSGTGATNFLSNSQNLAMQAETFSGGTLRLGSDSLSAARAFNGLMNDAVLFTNSMTSSQVLQYFLTALGASALAPNFATATTTAPAEAGGPGVYSGQNVRLQASVSGSMPLALQWQTSLDLMTWVNVPGATNSSQLISPQTVGTYYYQLVATNVAGNATSAPPATVIFTALPATPAGLWTANFQYTNNISGNTQTTNNTGLGNYSGRGILGSGMYWNGVSDPRNSTVANDVYNGKYVSSGPGLLDDGVTQSGVTCLFNNGGAYNGETTLQFTSDVTSLVDQWFRGYFDHGPGGGAYTLQLTNVPAGTYNLVCYGGDGLTSQGSVNQGTTYVVNDSRNGIQANSTVCTTHVTSLQQGVNFVVFTNVHASGILNVDVMPNTNNPTSDQTWGDISAAQLQLVSYDPPTAAFSGTPTNAFVFQPVVFQNTSAGSVTNSVWSFGDGISVTNSSTASVSHSYAAAGMYTVSLIVSGPGGGPNTATQTSYIGVYPSLQISTASFTGGSLILSGVNGTPGEPYRILTATNVAQPLATWTTVATSTFGANGSYSYTNSAPTNSASFFRVVSP